MKKILSMILAFAMILTSVSVAFAEETESAADYILYVNAEWTAESVLDEGLVYGINAFSKLEDAAAKIATDGSNTTIKLLSDVEVGTIDLKYGEGDVILTADFPVVIKQPNLSTDLGLVDSKAMNFVIDTNVTFEVYDNNSGVYLYYGPSITINGAVTGGQNWGCLYLYNGEHTVSETGTIGVGRIQIGATTLTVNGTVDTNYLLVEGSNFVANGATVDATDVYDSNKGGMRWGASTFEFTNGSVVNAGTVTLGYADSALTIDTTSTLTANKIKGKGTIVIDAADYTEGDELNIQADFSGFTGKFDVINENGAALMASVDGDKIVLTEAAASVTDVNGNGKGSYASLKEAFDAASEGDIVLLHKAPGNTVTIPKAVTLRGDAPSLTRSLTTDGMVEFNNYPLTVASGIDGTVKVENIAFTGTANQTVYIPVGGNYENTSLEIDNCYFEYNLNRGIIVNSQLKGFELTNSVIENKSTSYIKDYSVWFNPKAPSEVEISNNEFIGGGLLRGAMHLGETAPDNATITVSGNSVDGFERGIQMAQSGSVTIDVADNTFTNIAKGTGSSSGDNELGAIYIHKVATTDAKLNITDNSIDDSASLIYSQNHYSANDFIANFDGNTAGNETIVTPDESTTIYDYTAAVGNKYYDNLEDAFKDVQDGETIELGKDVILKDPIVFNGDITFTLDGKGHSIKEAADFSSEWHTLHLGDGDDSTVSTKVYTIKNVVFDGITTKYGLRLKGIDAIVENCKFINANQTAGFGLLSLTFCEADVIDCVFEANVCARAIDVNYNGDGSQKDILVDGCTFDNNKAVDTAIIHYAAGGKTLTINDCVFNENTVETSGNAAVVYLGFRDGASVTGCTFTDNVVNTTSATSKRVAAAIQTGEPNAVITGNIFVGNTATRNDADAGFAQVNEAGYYGRGNLGENYWGGNAPVIGVDIAQEYSKYKVKVESYYTELSAEGKPTTIVYDLEDVAVVNKKVVLEQVMNGTEGTHEFKVYLEGEYNNTEAVIDNLVAAEIDFEVTGEFAILGFEVSDSKWTSEVTANGSYLIREKGEANGTADIDGTRIFLGTITLEGYGNGAIEAACHYGAVEQRTASNNIVVSTIADPYALPFSVYVPRKDLTVEIDFNNAADKNVDAYQEMQVVVSGGDLAKAITVDLGNADKDVALDLKSKPGAKYTVDVDVDNKYIVTFEDALTLDTTYTVTVSGAGYRTVRKNATMANDVTVKFWNNVKDADGADYLAGDIVKDNTINIYDLSAVVSYFGRTNNTSAYSKYARYDLNRDGKIDSKDVAYVLVSWGK